MNYFDESAARRDARRDHDRGRCNREMYDRHSFDAIKEAYTEEWNTAKREKEREQVRREQVRREAAARERLKRESAMVELRQQDEFEQQQTETVLDDLGDTHRAG